MINPNLPTILPITDFLPSFFIPCSLSHTLILTAALSVSNLDFRAYSQFCSLNVCMLNHFSCVRLFATLWTVACQAPLCMGFSRQQYQSGLPCPPPGDLPDPRTEPGAPALQIDSSPLSHWESPQFDFSFKNKGQILLHLHTIPYTGSHRNEYKPKFLQSLI